MVPIIVLVILSMMPNPVFGSTRARNLWDPMGVPISIATGIQVRSAATNDGNGGAIIIWEDMRSGYHLYGQRINAKGECLWETNGTPLITVNPFATQEAVAIISDDAGGAIFTWVDSRYGTGYIFAQRIDGNGQAKWQDNGIPIMTVMSDNGGLNSAGSPQLTGDGEGGAIITWNEVRDGFHLSIYAQRVTADGTTLWDLDGVPVAKGPFYAYVPKIINDGSGGAIIAWQEINNNVLIFAQRLNSHGEPQWPINGIPVSDAIGQTGPQGFSMIDDQSGGALVTWVDRRIGFLDDANIYTQRISPDGQLQWQAGGVLICSHGGDQYCPVMCADGKGGAIIAWEDGGVSPPGSGQVWIFSQRIDQSGNCLWPVNGIPICTFQGFNPQIVSDGAGGAIIVWNGMNVAPSPQCILAQRVNANGKTLWPLNGFEVFLNYQSSSFEPKVLSDGKGGAIIRWRDERNVNITGPDIYAQRISDRVSNESIYLLLLD
jgi:hypothetical protein